MGGAPWGLFSWRHLINTGPCIVFFMFQMCYFLAALYVENPLQIQILCSPRTSAVPYFTDTVLVVQEVGFL